jgi:hypothetical protein
VNWVPKVDTVTDPKTTNVLDERVGGVSVELMKYRRVVTGNSPDGTPVVHSDTWIDLDDGGVHATWGADGAPNLSIDGSIPDPIGLTPPPGGCRVVRFVVPASDGYGQIDELEGSVAGVLEARNTVDAIVVLSGEAYIQHGNGDEVHLSAGDVLIQNGTSHAWCNRSTVPMVGVSFIVGAAAAAEGAQSTPC